jgi:DNA-binding beta-propeller fold protein YncE
MIVAHPVSSIFRRPPTSLLRRWRVAGLAASFMAGSAFAGTSDSVPPLSLRAVADIPLGGHSTRLDYASIDAATYKITARMPGGVYPDGMAYAPDVHKLYVSDEHGGTDTVIDIRANRPVATIRIGGVIGNTQYDAETRHIFVNAQTKSELVEIDPATDTVVRRLPVPGAKGNHGLLIDSASHRAFIACEGNDRLVVLDLRTRKALASFSVAKDPDVLALDPGRQDLYVAGESGQVTAFKLGTGTVVKAAESFLADNAHVVAVDPNTHEIYFPLEDVNGKTVLRIMSPAP